MTSKASAAAKACLETLLKLSLWNFSCLYRLPLAIHSSVWILISCSHPRHPSCIIGLLYFSHLILSKPTDSENTYVNGMLVFVIAEGDFFWNGHCFVWRIHLSATVPGSFQPTSRTQQLMRRLATWNCMLSECLGESFSNCNNIYSWYNMMNDLETEESIRESERRLRLMQTSLTGFSKSMFVSKIICPTVEL